MATGTIKKWFGDRGFGFAAKDDGTGDVFVHCRQIVGSMDHLTEGQRVSFEEGIDQRTGKNCAQNVRVI